MSAYRRKGSASLVGVALLLAQGAPVSGQTIDINGIIGGLVQGAIQAQQQRRPIDQRPPPRTRYPASDARPDTLDDDPRQPRERDEPASQTALRPSPYAVDGFTLGGEVEQRALPNGYVCEASDQFARFTWCRIKRQGSNQTGRSVASTSLLVGADQKIVYANKFIAPATFGSGEITAEVNRLTAKFHNRPRVLTLPAKAGLPNGMIVTWGDIGLDRLDPQTLRLLADGKSVNSGILVDFLGDVRLSAQQGQPVYRLGGGAGFLWAASYDQNGRGNLRFGTSNAALFRPSVGTASSTPFDASQVAGFEGQTTMASSPSSGPAASGLAGIAPGPEMSAEAAPGILAAASAQAAPGLIGVGSVVDPPSPGSLGTAPAYGLAASPATQQPTMKTVIVEGVGTDIESAAKNAAQNALTQVVGSFIDTNTMVTKQALIANGIRTETKDISATIREYSQGAIQSIALGTPTSDAGLTRVSATVTVRVEDFKAYITKAAVGEASMGAGLFAQMASAQENQKNLESIVYDKVFRPILYGETVEVKVGSPVPFNQTGLPSSTIGQWNPTATVVFPVQLALSKNFLQNLGKTLDSVSSGFDREPYSARMENCQAKLHPFDPASEVGISVMTDRLMFDRGRQEYDGLPIATYKLSNVRSQRIDDKTKLDIQIEDASGATLFESVRTERYDRNPTSLIETKLNQDMPWRLIEQDGACIDIASVSSFRVMMQLDAATLRNAAKVAITIRR